MIKSNWGRRGDNSLEKLLAKEEGRCCLAGDVQQSGIPISHRQDMNNTAVEQLWMTFNQRIFDGVEWRTMLGSY